MYSKLLKKSKSTLKVILILFIIYSIVFAILSFTSGLYFMLSLVFILLSICFAFSLKFNKYFKMEKLKNKIETNFNFTKFDVEEDFNNAINIDRIWIGNKFIILLAEKEADLIVNENLALAFIFKKLLPSNQIIPYYLFTIDFDGNKNITFIPSLNNKILEIIEEKCPNACVGYSKQLENIAFINVENIKNFDKSKLNKHYIPNFNNIKLFLNL